MSKERTKFDRLFHVTSGVLITLSAPGVLIFQLYKYLRTDTWIEISFLDVLAKINFQWAIDPTDWFGLWRVLNWLPLSVVLLLLGLYVLHQYDLTEREGT
ncbi:hypothetical protein MED121_03507 [Marinomonas sp. MED121]|uniref:hypothetical protein n=1 Tax=Marinomonas sp. MED121 TaxID=314277 RepID=UPI000068FD48|nr:hypothetical protein [Marinomonas sp. MED121]EAQ63732.1 hypothetical protein MED121_03507 [Marinomonas sp. MED121]